MEILRTVAHGETSVVLRRNAGALELLLGNVVLLSSAALETELDFGRLAERAPREGAMHVVIGGLGFASTLRGCLEVVPAAARVTVVEKLRPVIDLAREDSAELVGGALDDPRTELVVGDVADVIASSEPSAFSAILLDVDNGPEWASFRTNARLYGEAALVRAREALVPGGIFAVWSGYPRDAFLQTLRRARFEPKVEPLRERGSVRARAYLGVVK